MRPSECNDLGAIIQSYDERTWGESNVIAWMGVVGDLTFAECREAVVGHYASTTDRIMPAHVRKRVLAARQDSAMRAIPGGNDELVTMPDWFWTTVEHYKTRTREDNAARKARGELPRFGETITRPSDHRP